MKNSSKQRISLAIFCLLALVIIFNRLLFNRFDTHNIFAILSWDVFGYYLYLPATFIHHDLGIRNFGWLQQVMDTYNPTIGFYQAYMGPAGEYVMKYPVGMALMYSPFFLIGHVAAHLTGYSPDGFTLPYQLSIAIGGLVYTAIGLWFLRKILLHFFTDGVVAITMVLIVAGTNYFQLTAFDGSMPHNYLFTLFAVIVWLTIRWHENPRWSYAIMLGLGFGLVALVRPTAIIIVLVTILWGLWDGDSWRKKITLVIRHWAQVLAMAVAAILVVSLQMIYWKLHAGSWIYYSYEVGLEWIAPYLQKVLFSYRKGWLLYTPLMIFALAGFISLFRKNRSIFLAVFVFFIIHLVIIASWPIWWYGGSFSQRTMMESYALLAFPMGALVQWILKQRAGLRFSFLTLFALLVFLNLFQTWQYMNYVLDPSRMTKAYYWATFGKTHVSAREQLFLEPSDLNSEREFLSDTAGYTPKVIVFYDFEQPDQANPGNFCRDTAYAGSYSLRMSRKMEFSPGINAPYGELTKKDFAWIRASAWIYFTCKPEEAACGLVITCNRNGKAYKYRQLELEKANLKTGMWNRVTVDYMTPYFDDKTNTLQAYFWCRGDKEILVDNFEIRLFEPNE
ncbi:MAG: hypothetical protein ACOYNU_09290 [Bacteroidales bacterium]